VIGPHFDPPFRFRFCETRCRFKAGNKRNPCRCGNLHHGVALLCGFVTPSLAAQGGQRLPPYFNIGRDISAGIGIAVIPGLTV